MGLQFQLCAPHPPFSKGQRSQNPVLRRKLSQCKIQAPSALMTTELFCTEIKLFLLVLEKKRRYWEFSVSSEWWIHTHICLSISARPLSFLTEMWESLGQREKASQYSWKHSDEELDVWVPSHSSATSKCAIFCKSLSLVSLFINRRREATG